MAYSLFLSPIGIILFFCVRDSKRIKNVVHSYICDCTSLEYSSTFESRSDLSVDSAYILIRGSVPLGLSISQVCSSIHIFAPSSVSTFLGLPCSMHFFITLSTISLEGHANLVLYWKVCGSCAMCWENDLSDAAIISSTSAVDIAPSLTSFSGPYIKPPFSSSPSKHLRFTISLDTSTLPTLV